MITTLVLFVVVSVFYPCNLWEVLSHELTLGVVEKTIFLEVENSVDEVLLHAIAIDVNILKAGSCLIWFNRKGET